VTYAEGGWGGAQKKGEVTEKLKCFTMKTFILNVNEARTRTQEGWHPPSHEIVIKISRKPGNWVPDNLDKLDKELVGSKARIRPKSANTMQIFYGP